MKLVVGLGNPGEKYRHNRHNAGFVVVERLLNKVASLPAQAGSSSFKLQEKFKSEIARVGDTFFVKPQTFMNDSGWAVAQLANFYKIKCEEIYLIYDDLDIRFGEYKIQWDKGPKVHNGISSVREALSTNAFWHVRVGVENREVKGNGGVPGVEYSLQNFAPGEQKIFDSVVTKVVEDLSDKV